MPDNKNQHYVPRCHFKPFSLDREGAALSLFNHARDMIRIGVPVSGQCSKSYFYGKDLVIEKQLQQMEGLYGRTVQAIEEGRGPTDDDLEFLRSFALLQWCRTDGALRRRREALAAMGEMARRGVEHLRMEEPDLSQLSLILGSLKIWTRSLADIEDLHVLILRNRSRIDFVTSDDPAVVTNRVFLQRMQDTNFGLANIGAMLMMPLGPRHAVACYDHEAYAPIGRIGKFLNVERDQDARAFNELQFLNSISNIYFAGPFEKGESVREAFRQVADRRPETRFRTWQGISEGIEGEFECFRQIKEGETFDPYVTRIQQFSPLYPAPAHWMSSFTMRKDLHGWMRPGAVGGPLRASRAKRMVGLRRVKITYGMLPNRGELPERMYHALSKEELVRARLRELRNRQNAEGAASEPGTAPSVSSVE